MSLSNDDLRAKEKILKKAFNRASDIYENLSGIKDTTWEIEKDLLFAAQTVALVTSAQIEVDQALRPKFSKHKI